MSFVERSYPMQKFVLVNRTDVDIPRRIPRDHTELKISIVGRCWAVGSDQGRGEMEAGVHRNVSVWNSTCSLCSASLPQGSCCCCTQRTWLCSAACKNALVLVAGPRLLKNQFLPSKKTAADFNHHCWHCRGVISKTAWDCSVFISVGPIPACVHRCAEQHKLMFA